MTPGPDPYRYFRLEARELLDALGSGTAALERGAGDGALIQQMLRQAHTLKGAARVVRQTGIADEAHRIEDILAPLRESMGKASAASIEAISSHLGAIGDYLRAVDLPEPVAAASADSPPAAALAGEAAPRTVRADVDEVDRILDGISEAQVQVGTMRAGIAELADMQRTTDLLGVNIATVPGGQDHVSAARGRALARELVTAFDGVERRLSAAVDHADRELGALRETVEQMRLLPVNQLFAPTERAANDTARMLGRQVRFEASGGEARLDGSVIEAMQRILVQLVRNALAHGIEPPAERIAAGKSAAGRLRLAVTRLGDEIQFDFSDDGRGVDVEALRRVARQRGFADIGDGEIAPDALLRILMASGVSTAGTVTDVAGRGVGLDIVREAVEQIRGTISMRSRPGTGTGFHVRVPLSLASVDALHLDCGGVRVAIALDAILGTARLGPDQLSVTGDGTSVNHAGATIPFLPLEDLLEGAQPQGTRLWSVIVLRGARGKPAAAFGVDRLQGAAPIVARPLPPFTPCDPVVAGYWIDSDGNPQILLDANALVAAVRAGRRPIQHRQPSAPRILVIDDSMTTRMLEESILLAAGYVVDTATSGEEGLKTAGQQRYALFLVDVEMPGMDGFTFVERIRADPGLRDIPAILVTSRNAPEDIQRGTDAGAQGYIVKGEFDQKKLLTLIKELAA